MPKLLETIHQFRGYWSAGGRCRIEIYTASGLPPLIVATELPDNENTSITNVAEYVAAEVVERYLAPRAGLHAELSAPGSPRARRT